jgi:hypothetical protein
MHCSPRAENARTCRISRVWVGQQHALTQQADQLAGQRHLGTFAEVRDLLGERVVDIVVDPVGATG